MSGVATCRLTNQNLTFQLSLWDSAFRTNDHNDNLLLSVPMRGDGSIDKKDTAIVEGIDLNAYYTGRLDSSGKQVSVNVTRSFLNRSPVQHLTYQRQNPEAVFVSNPSFLRIINPIDQNSLIAQTDLSVPTKKGQWAVGVKYISIANDNELRQEQSRDGVYVVDPEFSSSGVYRENTYAGYGSFSRSLSHGWSLKTGLRLEKPARHLPAPLLTVPIPACFPV